MEVRKHGQRENCITPTYTVCGLDSGVLKLWTLAVVMPTRVYLLDFFYSSIQFYLLLSPYLCVISFLYLDLYVLGDDALNK